MSGIWDFIVTSMAFIQEFPAEVTSDQMSVTENILAAVWRVYWRVGISSGENEGQRNQVTCPRTQILPDVNPRAVSLKDGTPENTEDALL